LEIGCLTVIVITKDAIDCASLANWFDLITLQISVNYEVLKANEGKVVGGLRTFTLRSLQLAHPCRDLLIALAGRPGTFFDDL
jgi:hypothetical protein